MPEFQKILSGKRGVTAALAALLMVLCAGAGWWAWTVKARSAPRPVVHLAPVDSTPAPPVQKQSNATLQEDEQSAMAAPPTFDMDPPQQEPKDASVVTQNKQEVGDTPDPVGNALSDADRDDQPAELPEAGAIHEFSRLRTELERKKLEVEIARQNQQLRDLHFTTVSPGIAPGPVVTHPAVPRVIPPRVVSIYGRGNNLQAMVEQSGKGLVSISVGDRIGGETVMGITERGVVVGTGSQTRTLGFK